MRIFIVGDIHGAFNALFQNLDYHGISNCYLICVGDAGVGFNKTKEKELRYIQQLEERFRARNIRFISVRGNHDDAIFFDGTVNHDYFKLLPDYTKLELNGEKWFFVGGATSVDRTDRLPGRGYWLSEKFIFDPNKAEKCDILITHSGPNWIGPNTNTGIVAHYSQKDLHLWDELKEERREHQKLFDICRPKKWFLGHFHVPATAEHLDCRARILNILEIVEYVKTA
jgi:UDP-2,3-diacylglucosamine pyrophosphatase LpxH